MNQHKPLAKYDEDNEPMCEDQAEARLICDGQDQDVLNIYDTCGNDNGNVPFVVDSLLP